MTPLTIAAAAFVLGLLIGSIAVWGLPIFAIPIVLIVLAVIGWRQMRRRVEHAQSMGHMREQAAAEKVQFTDRDRETLV